MKTKSEIVIFTVTGNLPRKSNSRRIFKNRHTGKTFIAKSDSALNYEVHFMNEVRSCPALDVHEKQPVELTAMIYYQSRRSDLSDELLCDLLEKAEIIQNDRQIFSKRLVKRIDPEKPRVTFMLKAFEDKIC